MSNWTSRWRSASPSPRSPARSNSTVRYAVRRSLDLEIRRLVIHIDGLRVEPAGAPPVTINADPATIRPRDLADSGTDVA